MMKDIRCRWCGEDIIFGENYHQESYWKNSIHHTCKWHMECLLAHINSNENTFEPFHNERPKRKKQK